MRILRSLLCVAGVLLVPTLAVAQAITGGIVGVVRDTTGAVLPGVTVEATSPVLIEKVRTVVTDDQGRFNIIELRPGTYTVTFTLPGFTTVRREGVEVSGGFTATANADLKVGGVEETVTVTGAAPVVDIQNVRTQQVMRAEVMEALPTGARDYAQMASMTLGATSVTSNDVGGDSTDNIAAISMHGGRANDGRLTYDGLAAGSGFNTGGGVGRQWRFNMIAVQEMVVDTGGAGAEVETGGANINLIPREGANTFSLHSIVNYTTKGLASGDVPDSIVARGAPRNQNSMKRVWDYGVGIGGPVVKDRLWFYNANRFWGAEGFPANIFHNKSPVFYRYEPDLSRPLFGTSDWKNVGGRLTWQASQKNKVSTHLEYERGCNCPVFPQAGFGSPEALYNYPYGRFLPLDGMWWSSSTWNYPATNKLLFQASASFLLQNAPFTNLLKPNPGPNDISIIEQTTGFRWNSIAPGTNAGYEVNNPAHRFNQKVTMSYVTGSHNFKAGLETVQAILETRGNALPNGTSYTFRNGLPLSLTQWASPFGVNARVRQWGLFAQEQWTINRLTLNLGLRYDHFRDFAAEITLPAGPFRPERTFPKLDDTPKYDDLSPRIGVAWDVFGTGRTAIKGAWGRYVYAQSGSSVQPFAPSQAIFISTDRLWNDANGNFTPDCVLTNFAANGECGAIFNPQFGQPRTITTWDDRGREGWGVREFSYQYTAAVQHELRPGLGLTVSYHRTDYRNQQAIVNRALSPSDFTEYCITAPTDSRLGRYSGRQVCGLYDEVPGKFGLADNVIMRWQDVPGATGRPKQHFNGVDMAVNARFGNGGVLLGGLTLGRTVEDFCWLQGLPNVQQRDGSKVTPIQFVGSPRANDYCRVVRDSLWDDPGSQVKVQVVYPLPGSFYVSGIFKSVAGIPVFANFPITNQIAQAALGRPLAACRGVVPCTATAPVQLLPTTAIGIEQNTSALADDRLNEVDLRLTRMFRIGRGRIQPSAELYNVFNNRTPQQIVTTYGPIWQRPVLLLGGRLFKFGAQVDF